MIAINTGTIMALLKPQTKVVVTRLTQKIKEDESQCDEDYNGVKRGKGQDQNKL